MAHTDVDESILFPERASAGGTNRRRRSASRFATTSPVERRLIAGCAVVAGIAAAFGTVEPCGYPLSDALLRALAAVVVTLAASRARRWTWLWLGGVAAVAAGGLLEAVPALVAVVIGFVVAATSTRRRIVGAVVGALAVQTLVRLAALDPYGLSTMVFVAAVAPLLVSAWRVSPRRVKRRVRTGVLVVASVVVLGVLTLALAGVLAAGRTQAALEDALEGLEAARDGDDDRAYAALTDARDGFDSAHGVTAAWWVTPARLVPGLAQQARVLDVATGEGRAVTESGARVAGSVDVDELRLESGRLDLDMVRAVQRPLVDNAAALRSAGEALEDVDSAILVPPLAERVGDFRDRVEEVAPEAETAAEVAAVAPALLGGDGERRYFVIFTQPAEARGLGGFMGSWAELTAIDGDVVLSRHGRTNELRDTPGAEERTIDGPVDYYERYRRFRPWVTLQDITLSPDFPQVADVMAQVYPQTGGGELDGVLALDPYALGGLMELTGPIEVEGLDFALTSENAAEFLVRDQYLEFGADQETREDFLAEVTEQTFDRLTTGDLPGPREVADVLHPFVEQGRLVLWSRHRAEEDLFARIEATGAVSDRGGGDYLSVVTQNSANNKIDLFLERTVDYDVEVDPVTGRVQATVRVELFNNVTRLDLPEYVIGSNDQGLPLGTNEVWLNIYSPLRFAGARIDGQPGSIGTEREFDLWAYSDVYQIPAGGRLVVELDLEGAFGPLPGDRYQLTYDTQPLVNPDTVSIEVVGADGWMVDEAGDPDPVDGHPFVLEHDERLEAVLRRAG